MTFSFKSSPANKKVFIQIGRLEQSNKRALRQAFYFIGKDLVKDARDSIRKRPKSGRTYIINNRRHRASAPGEPPANLTGLLARSINFRVQGWSKMEIGADTPYARALELGNPKGNLEPRPYLIAAINKNERNTRRHFDRELNKHLTRLR